MTVMAHLSELQKKHEQLSQKIEAEQRSPGSDDLHVKELKVQKLRLKEEINRLSGTA